MSVESQLENTAPTDVVQRLEKDVDTDVDREVIEKKDSNSIDNNLQLPAGAENDAGSEISLSSLATDWFKGLTAEEQAGAISFSDGAFLGTFLAFASPWSTATAAAATKGEEPVRDVDTVMDWDGLVSLTEFESKYEELDGSLRSTPLLGNRKTFVGGKAVELPASASSKAAYPAAMEQESEGEAEVSHSLTIGKLETPEHGLLVPPSNQLDLYPSDWTDEKLLSRRWLFGQAALIFPSAFKHISGSVESHSHVAVRPSYFASTSDEEQALALTQHQTPFLTFDPNDDPLTWLRRLHGSSTNGQVPLSSLLLARFEWAIWESFLTFEHNRLRIQDGQSTSLIAVNSTMSSNRDDVRKHVLSNLGDILSHCGAMNDLSMTIDSTTLSRFVSPFIEACQPHNLSMSSSNQIEQVILVPLSWILHASGRGVSLDALDDAVDSSLSRMENHGPGNVGEDDAVTDPESPSITEGKAVESESSSPKKKKKKSKKKKKKKGPAAESSVVASSLEQVTLVFSDEEVDVPPKPNIPVVVEEHIAVESENAIENTDVSEETDSVDVVEVRVVEADTVMSASLQLGKSDDSADENEDESVSVSQTHEPATPSAIVETAPDVKADNDKDTGVEATDGANVDGDSWETVEVRGRGSRKKPVDRQFSSGPRHPIHFPTSATGTHDAHNKKLKSPRVAPITPKKKTVSRKIVRDILVSLVDSIEEESRRRKQAASQAVSTPPRATNSWKNGPPGARQPGVALRKDFASVVAGSGAPSGGKKNAQGGANQTVVVHATKSANASAEPDEVRGQLPEAVETPKSLNSRKDDDHVVDKRSPAAKKAKSYAGVLADQNTAPTYQETVSASSNARLESKEDPPNSEDRKSDSSSMADTTEEVPLIRDREVPTKVDSNLTSTPPLPTLLSPENANSATSSVASSLEAPHAGRMHHHSVAATGVNDVGYHLLDVCDRLSRDMSLFMSRRALALNARRRERGAILTALQDSVSSLWPRRCHVELYGSCATQLDLPSSDIDVVVLGLDRSDSMYPTGSDSIATNLSIDDNSLTDEVQQHQQHFQPSAFSMMPMHRNAERVLRLAAELEGQAWAVQVNAIPTASVPVVKVLADPSKLTSNGGEWMVQHQHMAAQVAAAAGKCQSVGSRSNQEYPNNEHGSYPTHLPWRGSDVMKGLLSLDITFEGLEHGGIGSTEFSTRIVMDACAEFGLHADATPFVQVLMVLKELLCQRKLNEPYSGGLSSYALLLLVLALVRERAVIKEEIELVEQQKRAMASADPSAFGNEQPNFNHSASAFSNSNHPAPLTTEPMVADVQVTPSPQKSSPLGVVASSTADGKDSHTVPSPSEAVKNAKSSVPPTQPEPIQKKKAAAPSPLSWASIAKTSVSPKPPKATVKADLSKEIPQHAPLESPREAKPSSNAPKKPSFADAVMRSTNGSAAFSSVPKKAMGETSSEADPSVKSKIVLGMSAATDKVVSPSEVSTPKKSPPQATVVTSTTSNSSALAASQRAAPEASPIGESSLRVAPPFYPQGYNDIVEVLCSGETTAGKLLMHFLLFYGQHFDAQSTAIDLSGKHERDFTNQSAPFSYMSPYIQRRARGNIDPITGMLTVDPIVIYDPLEGAENNNVARRCFCWNSVRWIFAQSYSTLASAVERSATPPSTPGGNSVPASPARDGRDREAISAAFNPEAIGDLSDPTSPLLKCLLSF